MNKKQLLGILVLSVSFGCLMAIREEFSNIFARAAIAGFAGALFGLGIYQCRKNA
jgi:hypothetical protein